MKTSRSTRRSIHDEHNEVEGLLAEAFRQSGYVRVPSTSLRRRLGQHYKKGYEVRLVVRTRRDLARIRRWLWLAGLAPGRSFRKHSRLVQPIYGKPATDRFLSLARGRRTRADRARRGHGGA